MKWFIFPYVSLLFSLSLLLFVSIVGLTYCRCLYIKYIALGVVGLNPIILLSTAGVYWCWIFLALFVGVCDFHQFASIFFYELENLCSFYAIPELNIYC